MDTELELVSSRRRACSSKGENSKPRFDKTKYDCETLELALNSDIIVM
jgi:hypothetical protein